MPVLPVIAPAIAPSVIARRFGPAVAAVLFASTAVACGDDGQARVVVETSEGRVTVTATSEADGSNRSSIGDATPEATPSPDVEASPEASPADGTPVQITPEATSAPATRTPAPTATPTPTPEPEAVDLRGTPHSTADVRAAVEARGQGFTTVGGARGCDGTSVPALRFWSRDPGSSAGPAFVLWVYPDSAARSADWDTSSGIVLPRVSGCTLPSSATYWNGNVVISFDGYIDDGAPAPRPPGSMRSHPVIDAILAMSR